MLMDFMDNVPCRRKRLRTKVGKFLKEEKKGLNN